MTLYIFVLHEMCLLILVKEMLISSPGWRFQCSLYETYEIYWNRFWTNCLGMEVMLLLTIVSENCRAYAILWITSVDVIPSDFSWNNSLFAVLEFDHELLERSHALEFICIVVRAFPEHICHNWLWRVPLLLCVAPSVWFRFRSVRANVGSSNLRFY